MNSVILTLIGILFIAAVSYLWYKVVYDPGKYNERKSYKPDYYGTNSGGDYWLGSYGDSSYYSSCDFSDGGCSDSGGCDGGGDCGGGDGGGGGSD